MEKLSEDSPEIVVKDDENNCISPAIEKHNLRPEILNVKPKMKEDIIRKMILFPLLLIKTNPDLKPQRSSVKQKWKLLI